MQGQQGYKPVTASPPTTTVPPPTSSTSTTSIGSGGTVNFPVTTVPDQAASLIAASGLVRNPGEPYYHEFTGAPFQLHLVVDTGDPWASAAALVVQDSLKDAGLDTTLTGEANATQTGKALASGSADLALLPVTFSPYMSQTLAWYTLSLGPAGTNGSQDWTGYDSPALEKELITASQQLNPVQAAGYYAQADTQLWQDMVALPLYAEPTVLAWNRTVGGVTPTPRGDSLLWYAQWWAVRRPESTSNTTPSLPGP